MHIRIANREDSDKTVSSEAVYLGHFGRQIVFEYFWYFASLKNEC